MIWCGYYNTHFIILEPSVGSPTSACFSNKLAYNYYTLLSSMEKDKVKVRKGL